MLNIEQFFLVNHLSIAEKTGLNNQENANPNSKGGAILEMEERKNNWDQNCGTRDWIPLFFFIEVYLTHKVTLVLEVQHSDSTSLHSPEVWLWSVTIQHYFSTIDYVPYPVPFIPMTYSFHNWKPVSPTPLLPIPPPSSLLENIRVFFFCFLYWLVSFCFLFVCLFIHLLFRFYM